MKQFENLPDFKSNETNIAARTLAGRKESGLRLPWGSELVTYRDRIKTVSLPDGRSLIFTDFSGEPAFFPVKWEVSAIEPDGTVKVKAVAKFGASLSIDKIFSPEQTECVAGRINTSTETEVPNKYLSQEILAKAEELILTSDKLVRNQPLPDGVEIQNDQNDNDCVRVKIPGKIYAIDFLRRSNIHTGIKISWILSKVKPDGSVYAKPYIGDMAGVVHDENGLEKSWYLENLKVLGIPSEIEVGILEEPIEPIFPIRGAGLERWEFEPRAREIRNHLMILFVSTK